MTDVALPPRERAGQVTVETSISDVHAEAFYDLYLQAFGPLRTQAVARQVLHRDEFFDEMSDPRIAKFVAWDADRQPVGMATLTQDLTTVPWISPEYFAARYPDYAARDAIYYLGFILVHPGRRAGTVFEEIITAGTDVLIAARAICAYDICAFNNEQMHLADRIESLVTPRGVEVVTIDTQTYYRATFG